MTRPRKALISLEDTPYYHCVSRCVRRAWLCGFDKLTARSFEHRRGWILDRMKGLASVFAIDIAAYAIMNSHHHAILHVDRKRALRWTQAEVFERWRQLFTGPVLMQKFLAGDVLLDVEAALVDQLCATYRERLSSISWFMRCLNEPIARWANAEDNCTGLAVVLKREVLPPDRWILDGIVELDDPEKGILGLLLALKNVHEQGQDRDRGDGGEYHSGRQRFVRLAVLFHIPPY